MPMDIRSYFSKTPESKSSTVKAPENGSSKAKKSRKRVFIDSDSEDESTKSKAEQKVKVEKKKKKSEVNETSKYFEVSKNEVDNIFGKRPIKRVEQPKPAKKVNIKVEIEDIDWEDAFAMAESAALAEKGSRSLSSPEQDSPTIRPVSKEDKRSPERIEETSSSKKESPKKSLFKALESPKKRKRDESPKKESPKKHAPKSNESPKQLETKDKKEPIQVTSRDHELSPSPERDDVEPVKPLQKSPKKEISTFQKDDKTSSPKAHKFYSNTSRKGTNSLKKSDQLERKKNKSEEKSPESKPVKFIREEKKEDPLCKLWVDKYKPANLKQIIGQQGEKSNVNKLVKWLKNWYSNHSGNKKITRPSPWAKDDSGAYFKAALLSGPPGVGKTTTAHLVCKELGMDFVEFNASDTRSKRLLKEEISDLLKSKSLSAFSSGGEGVSREHVLVMDEVDGMAGNEDRGGVQELIQLIKTSRVPIICMCNDRNHPKIRSLANYCFDLRFSKPRAEQIKGAMMSVCFKEGLKIKPEVLNDIIVNTNQDIRLILNHLSILAAQSDVNMPSASKYVKLGPWDVARKVFSEQDHKSMSIFDKCDLFFYDYNIAPLFVQENYLNVQPHSQASKTKKGKMALFAKAASSIACGDLVEKAIRSCNAWSLLPVQAVFSSYMPGEYLVGHMGGQINFPAWLGKNSRQGKIDRMSQEIQAHTRLKVSGGKEAVKLDYGSVLKERIVRPLVDHGAEGVEDSLHFLREYSLLREDLDSLSEITTWPNQPDPFSKLESKVKSAFTRAYNKNPVVTPFSISAPVKKGRGGGAGEADLGEEDLEEVEDEDDDDQDDISKDGMIMAPKKKAGKEESKKGETSGATSKRGGGRGKRGKK